MPTSDTEVIEEGQRAIAVSVQEGDMVYDGGATDIQCIVSKDGKAQRALKVAVVAGGGGGGGDSVIKDYEAPSYTINSTLFSSPVPIPNLDALTEEGTYRVHFNLDMEEGATVTATYIADVASIKVSGMALGYMQNLYVGPGGGDSVSIARIGMIGEGSAITWADWSGNSIADINTKLSAKLENTATASTSLTILGTAASQHNAVNVGKGATTNYYGTSCGYYAVSAREAVAIGASCTANQQQAIGIGYRAQAVATLSIQLGEGANSTANTFQVWSHTLLDKTTGKIPMARLPIVQLTQADYDALVAGGTVDANTIYCIIPA